MPARGPGTATRGHHGRARHIWVRTMKRDSFKIHRAALGTTPPVQEFAGERSVIPVKERIAVSQAPAKSREWLIRHAQRFRRGNPRGNGRTVATLPSWTSVEGATSNAEKRPLAWVAVLDDPNRFSLVRPRRLEPLTSCSGQRGAFCAWFSPCASYLKSSRPPRSAGEYTGFSSKWKDGFQTERASTQWPAA